MQQLPYNIINKDYIHIFYFSDTLPINSKCMYIKTHKSAAFTQMCVIECMSAATRLCHPKGGFI